MQYLISILCCFLFFAYTVPICFAKKPTSRPVNKINPYTPSEKVKNSVVLKTAKKNFYSANQCVRELSNAYIKAAYYRVVQRTNFSMISTYMTAVLYRRETNRHTLLSALHAAEYLIMYSRDKKKKILFLNLMRKYVAFFCIKEARLPIKNPRIKKKKQQKIKPGQKPA